MLNSFYVQCDLWYNYQKLFSNKYVVDKLRVVLRTMVLIYQLLMLTRTMLLA